MISADQRRFLDAWAAMATLFSFSPSTARVCALLISADGPQSPTEIAEALGTSRGNVSMCLKELRGWGVLQRVSQPGDRREFFTSRGDLFAQTLSIVRERQRREFDPMLGSALEALRTLADNAPRGEAERLRAVGDYLTTLDRLGREILDNQPAALAIVGMLMRDFGGRGSAPTGEA